MSRAEEISTMSGSEPIQAGRYRCVIIDTEVIWVVPEGPDESGTYRIPIYDNGVWRGRFWMNEDQLRRGLVDKERLDDVLERHLPKGPTGEGVAGDESKPLEPAVDDRGWIFIPYPEDHPRRATRCYPGCGVFSDGRRHMPDCPEVVMWRKALA